MRWLITWTVAISGLLFPAEASLAQQIELPETFVADGITYKGVKYISHDDTNVRVAHDAGYASLKISDLPSDVRFELGGLSTYASGHINKASINKVNDEDSYEDPVLTKVKEDRKKLVREWGNMNGEMREPSALASNEEWEAYKAWQLMNAIERKEATVADLPEDYGGRPTGSSSRAIAARKAWDRNQALERESRLIKEGRIAEATELRQMRLQEEQNESIEILRNSVGSLHQEIEQLKWQQRTGQSR
jgi:hypothetical protein